MMIHILIITLFLGVCVSFTWFALWNGEKVKIWLTGLKHRRSLHVLSRERHRRALEQDTKNPKVIQDALLLETLHKHQHTQYGQEHHFKALTDVSTFRRLHPLTEYCDYKDYMQRISLGEENVLVQNRPHTLVATAGTSGIPKIVPLSALSSTDRFLQGTSVYLEVVHTNFPGALEHVIKFTLPPSIQHTEAGISIIPYPSVFSSSVLEHHCSSPIPVHPAMSHRDALYIQLLFALKDPQLSMLEANFSWLFRYAFSILEESWESLVIAIQRGRLGSELKLSLDTRMQMEDVLVPDSVRAAELRAEFEKGFRGIAKRVWPKLQVIMAMAAGGSDLDRQILKDTACQGMPVYSPIYSAAEGLFGVNLWPKEEVPRYVLCPRSAFFEFIPEDIMEQEQPSSVCMQDVSEGKAYEMVITNTDGLYRYRLGDVIQVIGFHNHSPILEFLYRKSQTLNVRGESISECSFYRSLLRTVQMWPGATLLNYCCIESGILGQLSGGSDPHYEVFIALKGVRNLSEDQRYKLDQTLQEHIPQYKSFRFKGSIGPLRVHLTSPQAFIKLIQQAAGLSGSSLDCVQPPRTLRFRELAESIRKQILS